MRPTSLRCVYSPDSSLPGRRIHLDGRRLILGRSSDCTVQIMDREVSRHHMVFEPSSDGTYMLEDLGSPNGTFLDGTPCRRTRLDGQVLVLGRSFFVRDDEPSLDALPRSPLVGSAELPTLVGNSRTTLALRQCILTVAQTEGSVLIQGPTGVGKEVAARALHAASGRRGPFIPVNCAAVPNELAEAEFFGYRKGSFTGAERDAVGYFERAEGGTLFLDEVGDLPLALQPKLLRVLEDHTIEPLGSASPRKIDIRIVAATQVPPAHSLFRKDLLARLGDWVIRIPALAERRADIIPLWLHYHGSKRPMHAEFLEALLLHDWPTNVRGLIQTARKLRALLTSDVALSAEVLPDHIREEVAGKRAKPQPMPPPVELRPQGEGAPTREGLIEALRAARGNLKKIARDRNWHRNQVYRWLRKYELDPNDYRATATR
ncbi:MAG: sigma 54-interacting transcriptional regulator [Myxococcota bacterium]